MTWGKDFLSRTQKILLEKVMCITFKELLFIKKYHLEGESATQKVEEDIHRR